MGWDLRVGGEWVREGGGGHEGEKENRSLRKSEGPARQQQRPQTALALLSQNPNSGLTPTLGSCDFALCRLGPVEEGVLRPTRLNIHFNLSSSRSRNSSQHTLNYTTAPNLAISQSDYCA